MKNATQWFIFSLAAALLMPGIAESRPRVKKAAKTEAATTETKMEKAPVETKTETKMETAAPVAMAEKKLDIVLPFYVYSEKQAKMSYIPSGWMGDYADLKFDDNFKENPRSGLTCTQIIYSAQRKNNAGWAGIYWQHPANNWGNKMGGYNLTNVKKLVFWVRGDKGGETIAEFKVGGITSQTQPGDSDSISIGPIRLTRSWERYEIDLTGKDLSHIIGGFAFAASADDNPQGFTIYLDDIYFE